MKKIIIILPTGEEILVGFASSLYEFLLETRKKIIVPMHGHKDYMLVKNIYYPKLKEFVSYKAIKC